MPEKREYQGQTYERAGPGQPWVLVTAPSGPAPVTIGRPDPYRAAEEARRNEDQEFQRRQVSISEQNAAIAAQNANKPPEGYMVGPDGNLTYRPGGPADPAVIAARKAAEATGAKKPSGDPDRGTQILVALENLKQLRELAGQTLSVGKTSEWASGLPVVGPLIGQNRADVLGSLEMVQGDLIQQQIAKLSAINQGGVSQLANTEKEAQRMAGAIANLDPNQSPEQFQIGIDRAEAYYRRQLEAMKAASGVPASAAGAGATEGSIPIPAEMQAEHMAYLRANWGRLDPQGYAQFRAGLDAKYDFNPDPQAYRDAVGRLNERAAQGGTPDAAFIPPVTVPLSEGEQATNDFVNSAAGRGATAFTNSVGAGLPGLLANTFTEGGQMDLMRQESSGEMFLGDLVGGAVGTGVMGQGLGLAGKFISPRLAPALANPLSADALYGAVYGGAEGGVTGAVGGVVGSLVGNAAGKRIGQALGQRAAGPDPLNSSERAIQSVTGDIDPVVAALRQADDLGVPMTLADASPELGSLAGSATRFSPTTAGTAREVMARRNQGQVDRLAAAVERDLGPVTNIPQRSEELIAQARTAAGPLYDQAYAAPGVEDLQIADLLSRPSMTRALPKARNIVLEEGGNPDELGLVLNEAGDVVLSDAGRYTEARGPRPSGGGSVISGAGNRAPDDLVTFVRQSGGLRDQGGELSFLDLDNKPRTGVRMAGGEAGRGRLVNNESGRSFDEMAEAAWEAGYFGPPETTPRPTTTDFLMALEDTHLGTNRVFSVYDDDVVSRFNAAEENVAAWRNAEGEMVDNAAPIGMDELPTTPLDAYGSVQPVSPTWQTLDYVKRGLDDVLEGYRDPTTGRLVLDTEGNAVNATLQDFKSRMDVANPAYGAARQAYAGPVAERGFLRQGQDAIRTRPDELGVQMGNLSPEQAAQMRLGYQSELMGRANDVRSNGNPWAQLNTPNTEGRLGVLYEGAEDADVARLLSQRDLELQLAGSANRLIGNSATAERSIADEFFKQTPGIGGDVAQGVAETALLGGPFLTVGKRVGDRLFRERRERAAMEANRALADELGPILLQDAPGEASAMLSDIDARAAAYDPVLQALLAKYGERAGHIGAGMGAAIGTWPTR